MNIETHYSKEFNVENKIFKLHIIARGIIIDGSKILVCKNKTNTFLPGGHLEFGENLKNTLEREIDEELGFKCTVGKYIGCMECIWKEQNINNQEINHIFFIKGITQNDEIISKEKHITFYWIDTEDMEKENFLPVMMRDIVKNIVNGKNEAQYNSEIQK
jgi:ADP-ribose pyrophosphatase YjhB (NUDIX family)